ncbi:MAG: phosphate/phosphite/phosphonate ABC transporter substrate-binding protein, partial [Opitutaceae bacterium]
MFVACAAAILLTAGCSSSEPDGAKSRRPDELRIGWSPSEEEPDRRARYDDLRVFLADRLRMPVTLIETGTYSTQIEAFRARKIEVGLISPFSYVIARQKIAIEPVVVRGFEDGAQGSYHSVLIVPPVSAVRTIDDLKAGASKMTIAFVDPGSTSGHLMPRAFLETIGLNPDERFKQVVFTMSHLASAMTIKSGKIDMVATMNTGLGRLVERGLIAAED